MSWRPLRLVDRVQLHTATQQELEHLRAVVDRDLKDAALPGLSEDRCFATAYNAVLQLARMAIACAGYRVSAREGHHQTNFQALELAMGPAVSSLARYLDTCRRKRNTVDYDLAYRVTGTEAQELMQKAREFQELVETWIAQHQPNLARQTPSAASSDFVPAP